MAKKPSGFGFVMLVVVLAVVLLLAARQWRSVAPTALQVSDPDRWGLAGKADQTKAYFQCLDPYEYTGGGTVVFEVNRIDQ